MYIYKYFYVFVFQLNLFELVNKITFGLSNTDSKQYTDKINFKLFFFQTLQNPEAKLIKQAFKR